VGQGATTTILMAAPEGGRRNRSAARRSTADAASAARTSSAVRHYAAILSLEQLADPDRLVQRPQRASSGSNADQSDAALRGHPAGRGRLSARAACCPSSTTLRESHQPAAAGPRIDLAILQSATKYLNGHSDVTGGVVTGFGGTDCADRKAAADGRTVMDRIRRTHSDAD